MSDTPPQSLTVNAAGEPADLVRVGTFATRHAAGEHGLVVLAMGLPYWLEEAAEGYGVLVEALHAEAVSKDLALYDHTNLNWPPPPVVLPVSRAVLPWFMPLCWAAAVVWVFGAQVQNMEDFVKYGALDGAAVWRHAEWWRVLTSLFLHADLRHVLGNVTIGAFVFTQVVIARGTARGWFELAIASLAANAITAAIYLDDGTVSLGASTAVFAGIGVLTGAAVRAGWRAPRLIRWRAILVPLSAGFVLLALLGTGDARTDVVAHAMGFAAGLMVGAFPRRAINPATEEKADEVGALR